MKFRETRTHVLIYSLTKKYFYGCCSTGFLFEKIIKEKLPLVEQFYSCVGRERKNNLLA
jgi:hypothetical protein